MAAQQTEEAVQVRGIELSEQSLILAGNQECCQSVLMR